MSNHAGSYLLRDVLGMLTEAGVWQPMPRTTMQELMLQVCKFAYDRYDCNVGEILEGNDAFGICLSCQKPAEPLYEGQCLECWPEGPEEAYDEDADDNHTQ